MSINSIKSTEYISKISDYREPLGLLGIGMIINYPYVNLWIKDDEKVYTNSLKFSIDDIKYDIDIVDVIDYEIKRTVYSLIGNIIDSKCL